MINNVIIIVVIIVILIDNSNAYSSSLNSINRNIIVSNRNKATSLSRNIIYDNSNRVNRANSIKLNGIVSIANGLTGASLANGLALVKVNTWYIWACLSITSSLGIILERTKLGAMLSSPLVTMALSMLLCNLGLLPASHPIYNFVTKYLIPLAIPLLLLDADLKKCIKKTGTLLKAFLCGAIGTIIGTIVAFKMIPMKSVIGAEKIAAALCARHIGGAVNFVAVSDFFKTPADAVAAALAADNVVVALYFAFLFAISVPSKESDPVELPIVNQLEAPPTAIKETSKCPMAPLLGLFEMDADNSTSVNNEIIIPKPQPKVTPLPKVNYSVPTITLQSLSSALCISLIMCALAEALSFLTKGSFMLYVSLITVLGATIFPKTIGSSSESGGILGVLLMQFFFSVTGAMGHIPTVLKMAPVLFAHAALQISVHFIVALGLGKLFNLPFREIVLASNANVGGPTTAAAMASSKRWKLLVLPALLTGVFGYAIATAVGILLGNCFIRGVI
jgi:uncharacterized membrane protein